MKNRPLFKILSLCLIFLMMFGQPTMVFSLPQGQTLVAGSAGFSQEGSTFNVNQATGKAIINYDSFNIATGETVNFFQPSTNSIALNRVTGGDLSSIYGSLNANGQVFLINPSGILFGQGANINVHGLVASTLDIANDNFLAGNYKFLQDPAKALGQVANLGVLTAKDGGYVVLAAPTVENSGLIQANLGTIALGSGQGFTIALANDRLMSFAVDEAVSQQLQTYLNNKGTLKADSGTILIEAKVAEEIVGAVVNNDGLIEANTIVQDKPGVIKLVSNKSITNTGTIRANATDYSKAGNIDVIAGKTLTLAPTSHIEAKGKYIESAGGKVYLYSYGDAKAEGGQTIDISGGTVSGDAGEAELSSAGLLELKGANLFGYAQEGYNKGEFVFDPTLLQISGYNNTHGGSFSNSGNAVIHLTGSEVLTEGGNFSVNANGTGSGTWEDPDNPGTYYNWGDYVINPGATIDTAAGSIYIYANRDIITAGDLTTSTGTIVFQPDFNNDDIGDFTMTGGNILIPSGNTKTIYISTVLTGPNVENVYLLGGNLSNLGTGYINIFADKDVVFGGTNVTVARQLTVYPDVDLDGEGDITVSAGKIEVLPGGYTLTLPYNWNFRTATLTLSGGELINSGTGYVQLRALQDIFISGTEITTAQGDVILNANNITATGGTITISGGTGGGVGNITVDASGGDINFLGQGGSIINNSAEGVIYLYTAVTGGDININNIHLSGNDNMFLYARGGDITIYDGTIRAGRNIDIRANGDAYITGIDASGLSGRLYVVADEIFDAQDRSTYTGNPLEYFDIYVGSFDPAVISSKVTLVSAATPSGWPLGNTEPGASWPGIGEGVYPNPLEVFGLPPLVTDIEQEDQEIKVQRKMFGQTMPRFECTAFSSSIMIR